MDKIYIELSLVRVTDVKTGKISYFGVSDKEYDGMLACGGSVLEQEYSWDWLGDVSISENALREKGYHFQEETS